MDLTLMNLQGLVDSKELDPGFTRHSEVILWEDLPSDRLRSRAAGRLDGKTLFDFRTDSHWAGVGAEGDLSVSHFEIRQRRYRSKSV